MTKNTSPNSSYVPHQAGSEPEYYGAEDQTGDSNTESNTLPYSAEHQCAHAYQCLSAYHRNALNANIIQPGVPNS